MTIQPALCPHLGLQPSHSNSAGENRALKPAPGSRPGAQRPALKMGRSQLAPKTHEGSLRQRGREETLRSEEQGRKSHATGVPGQVGGKPTHECLKGPRRPGTTKEGERHGHQGSSQATGTVPRDPPPPLSLQDNSGSALSPTPWQPGKSRRLELGGCPWPSAAGGEHEKARLRSPTIWWANHFPTQKGP